MIAHHRVDDHAGVRTREVSNKLFDHRDLVQGTEVTGQDAVKPQSQFLPLIRISLKMRSEVLDKTAWESGVVGEQGRRSGTALDTEPGDDGQRHGQGTAAEAGKVVDHGDSFLPIVYAAVGSVFVL